MIPCDWVMSKEGGACGFSLLALLGQFYLHRLPRVHVVISLAHDVAQEKAVDAPNVLEQGLGTVSPNGTTDRYQYTGTYHGVIHSHLDAVDCHIMFEGKGYNGREMEDITAAGGCPKGNIDALKDGVVTRAILQ